MNTVRKTFGSTVVLALLFALAIICGASVTRADDLPFGYTTDVEKRPAESGEKQRIHIFNQQKQKVSIKVEFLNGNSEIQSLYPDGKVKTRTINDAKSGDRTEKHYYPKGELALEKVNGAKLFERRELSDGTYEATRYKPDGVHPQMIRRVMPSGAFELKHFRTGKSHELWFDAVIPGTSGNPEWNYYAKDGKSLRRTVDSTNKSMTVRALSSDKTFLFEQVWQLNDKGSYTLQAVTVPTKDKDSSTRYRLKKDGQTVELVEELTPAGQVERSFAPKPADKPDKEMLQEYGGDDDPTVPEVDEE